MGDRWQTPPAGNVFTSDGLARTGVTYLHNLILSAGVTGGAWQLNDSSDDSGTDLVAGVEQPNTSSHALGPFDPPIHFALGLYVDIPGTNITVNVIYSSE